ncbi:hypothetical protein [Paenibacillus ihuae]|uniref:hypothetical protein n=1 Tax=Paenibacillus ihuae TaxID=1232431 RepID=UPI0006D54EE3|nr:hypothetical protein [Paenibacillus ihuae]
MKRLILKVTAVALLISQLLTIGGGIQDKTVSAAAGSTIQSVPVMTDNLLKYGLEKDIQLPATVTANGFSYTLEKIMIYETKSATAQSLIKLYDYLGTEKSKYFIWTKITIKNESGNIVQQNVKDLSDKWRFDFGEDAWSAMPDKMVKEKNSTKALWDWVLLPGKQLTTYQAFTYNGDFDFFSIRLIIKNASNKLYIVKK